TQLEDGYLRWLVKSCDNEYLVGEAREELAWRGERWVDAAIVLRDIEEAVTARVSDDPNLDHEAAALVGDHLLDVFAAVRQLLGVRRIFAWRNNSGGFALGTGKARRFVRAGLTGSADILGVLPGSGKLLAVECKSATGRLSESQRAFLDRVNAAGGVALVVR